MIKEYNARLNDYNFDDAEPGKVELVPVEELKNEMFWIEGPKNDTYYEIPAINLIKDCEDYEPDGILCYLPDIDKFGTWDCDHWSLTVFSEATWEDIQSNPVPYLNAQWTDTELSVHQYDTSAYELIKGRPF